MTDPASRAKAGKEARLTPSGIAGTRPRLLGTILSFLLVAVPLAAQVADARRETSFLHGQYLRGHVWRGGIYNPPFAAPAGARLVY